MIKLSKTEEERARAIHEKSIVIDLHNHYPCHQDADQLLRGGVTGKIYLCLGGDTMGSDVFGYDYAATYQFDGFTKRALILLDHTVSDIEKNSDKFILALDAGHFSIAKREGKIALIMGNEGGKLLEGSLSLLRVFYKLGLRHLQLSWAFQNQITGAQDERSPGGLTNFGFDVVKEMNRLGLLIDVGHISEKGFFEVLDVSNDPVICGHSGARSLRPEQPQLLTDEQLKALAENRGILGMHFWSPILIRGQHATVEDLLNHVDHIASLVGVNCIGIGSDYSPTLQDPVTLARMHKHGWEYDGGTVDFVVADPSKMLDLTKGLVARGYSDAEVEKVLGGNFLRAAKDVFGS